MSDVTVRVKSDTKQAETGLKNLDNQVKGMGSGAKALGAAFTMVASGFAAVAATGAATVAIFSKAFDKYDAFAKLTRTGLSVQAVQNIALNADLAGTSVEEVAKAFSKLNRSLQFGTVAGDTKQVIEDLGLSVADLAKMTAEERIQALAGAISGIENPSLKSATAIALLGKSGENLIPFLDQITSAYEKQAVILNRSDVQAIEDVNDAWTKATTKVWAYVAAVGSAIIKQKDENLQVKSRLEDFLISKGYDENTAAAAVKSQDFLTERNGTESDKAEYRTTNEADALKAADKVKGKAQNQAQMQADEEAKATADIQAKADQEKELKDSKVQTDNRDLDNQIELLKISDERLRVIKEIEQATLKLVEAETGNDETGLEKKKAELELIKSKQKLESLDTKDSEKAKADKDKADLDEKNKKRDALGGQIDEAKEKLALASRGTGFGSLSSLAQVGGGVKGTDWAGLVGKNQKEENDKRLAEDQLKTLEDIRDALTP